MLSCFRVINYVWSSGRVLRNLMWGYQNWLTPSFPSSLPPHGETLPRSCNLALTYEKNSDMFILSLE